MADTQLIKLSPDEKGTTELRKLSPDETIDEDPSALGKIREGLSRVGQGVSNFASVVAEPLQNTVGDVTVGPEGVNFLSPEDIERLDAQGKRPGLFGEPLGPPKGAFQAGGELAGEALGAASPIGRGLALFKVGKTLSKGASKFDKVKALPRKFANQTAKRLRETPKTFIAEETGAGFAAGSAGFFATQIFPDSDFAKFAGEIVGGSVAPLTFAALSAGYRGVRTLINKAKAPGTEAGGRERAQGRIARAVTEEKKPGVLSNLDLETTIDPATGKPVLLPGARSGAPGLLSLEVDVSRLSDELADQADEQITTANRVIQESLNQVGDGSVAGAAPAISSIKESNAYLRNLLDTRVKIAAQRAGEKIHNLGPSVTREQANIVAREEIEAALKAARDQENELFKLVDPETKAPFNKSLAMLREIISETGEAQKVDIPTEANLLLKFSKKGGAEIPKGITPDELKAALTPEFTTIKELRALQSKLRQIERNARAGEKKNLNKARIAGEIADAITKDIEDIVVGPDQSDAVKTAVDFSRNLNERFNRGTVGKILGKEVTGGQRIDPALTLEQTIGTGPKAKVALENIIKVFDSPEAPSSALLIQSTEDFLRSKFLKAATHNGELDVRAAQRFIGQNGEILERLPNLKSQIDESVRMGDALALTERQKARVTLDNPKFSKATLFAEEGPVQAFKSMETLSPDAAGREMQLLINRVARDETGEALQGLKSGFVSFLTTGTRGTVRDVNDVPFLSGLALRDTLNNPSVKSMVSGLLTKGEQKRLNIIVRDLVLLEKRRIANKSKEGVIGDVAGESIRTLAGVLGAATGRRFGRTVGSGGTVQIPGEFSKRFKNMVDAGIKDPASRLLQDIVQDEVLFREFVQFTVDANGKISEQASRRLNFWAFNAIAEFGGTFGEDEDEENFGENR